MSLTRFQETIYGDGSTVAATITVYVADTTTLQSIYQDDAGNIPEINPFTTALDGIVSFYYNGSIDVLIQKTGYKNKWVTASSPYSSNIPLNVSSIIADYSLNENSDQILEVTCSSANITITMPLISDVVQGQQFGIKKVDATAYNVILNDSMATEIFRLSMENEGIWITSNGASWIKTGVM